MTIAQWLRVAERQLNAADIPSSRLDAELLLGLVFKVDRAWILVHDDEKITDADQATLHALLSRRLAHEPLAYLRGYQEFYGREFVVTPDTLIPRPESEALISLLLCQQLPTSPKILDVGTGSGCLAITIKCELTEATVTAYDKSQQALAVARQNAVNQGVDVHFFIADVTKMPTDQRFDVIIANLPYVDKKWPRSPETDFEPHQALFADHAGLRFVFSLIDQVKNLLRPKGLLLLEADTRQHEKIIQYARANELNLIDKDGLAIEFST